VAAQSVAQCWNRAAWRLTNAEAVKGSVDLFAAAQQTLI